MHFRLCWVSNSAWLGRGFFMRSGSRILRGGVWVFWPGDGENGFVRGLGSRELHWLGLGWLGLECDGGLGTTVAWVRREKKSPGTTSEERLCAEAPVRCRSCTSQPAISDVVTRDGPELYNRGDRSSMTAFGALLVVKLHWLCHWPGFRLLSTCRIRSHPESDILVTW